MHAQVQKHTQLTYNLSAKPSITENTKVCAGTDARYLQQPVAQCRMWRSTAGAVTAAATLMATIGQGRLDVREGGTEGVEMG